MTGAPDPAAPWPYGSGGACGPQFAREMAARLADLDRLGVRAALDLWIAEGRQGEALREVLMPRDWEAMERVWPAPPAGEGTR